MIGFGVLVGGSLVCSAQVNLVVSDLSSSAFTAIQGPNGGIFAEQGGEQQTGQSADDLVGSALDPGFYIGYGTFGTGGAEAVAFRFQMDVVGNKTEYKGNLRVGIDLDDNGSVDIFIGPKLSGSAASQGITFQLATGPGNPDDNTSPDTTSLGSTQQTIAFRTSGADANYSYQAQPTGTDPEIFNGDQDAILTFALSFTELNAALNALIPGASVASSSLMRFIAFTATNTNAINQDIYGTSGLSGTVRFDSGGGFSNYTDFTGAVIPEPSTFLCVSVLLLPPLLRRRRIRPAFPTSDPNP